MMASPVKLLLLSLGTVLLFGCSEVFAARILAIFPIPSVSHQIVPRPIWRELSRRGHQVTLITSHPMNDPTLTNLTEIDTSFMLTPEYKARHNFSEAVNRNSFGLKTMMDKFVVMFHEYMDDILSDARVAKLINDPTVEFDLVMIEYISPAMYAFQKRFNCPFIGLVSLDLPTAGHRVMGNPTHPILYPDSASPLTGDLSFPERMVSLFLFFFFAYYEFYIVTPFEDQTVRKHFGDGYPSVLELRDNVDLLFVNAFPVLHPVHPVVPGTIYIGGGMHFDKPKPLPKDLQSYLDKAKEGVIYFSLGSNVRSKDIPPKFKQTILDTFKELPYKVLWKFEADELEDKPDNVQIMKWLPQQDVLRHPNIVAFITQAGLQSTEEALFNHVPCLAIPFFGDQEMIAKLIVLKGFGLKIDHKKIDKKEFKEKLLEIITNKSYRLRAKELAILAEDEPMTGLEKAIWWTEYVLRHGSAKHLRGPGATLPHYQYFFLDIIAFLSAVIAILAGIVYAIVKCLKCLCRKLCKTTNKTKKKLKRN